MDKEKILIDDGEAELSIAYLPEELGPSVLSFITSNGGGFSSIYIGIDQIEKLIADLQEFVQEIKGT